MLKQRNSSLVNLRGGGGGVVGLKYGYAYWSPLSASLENNKSFQSRVIHLLIAVPSC
jgi:hypothetical protein